MPYQSEGNSSEKRKNRWTEEDTVRLLFIVNNVGRKWKLIADNYKSHLKNMNKEFLASKYWNLKQNKIQFEKLEEKSKLVKDVEILKYHENYSEVSCKSESLCERWSEDESIHLVYSVPKYGTDWDGLLSYYRTHVNQSRTFNGLKKQYSSIVKNPKRLLDLQEKAKLLNDGKESESIRFDKVINRMNSI